MTQKTRAHCAHSPGYARLAALVLTALTLCALLTARPARAAEWMAPYLEQVQEWGVMRGDAQGNLNEDRNITRAEFVTLVNRAFGYTDPSPELPFTDVRPNDWFAEDISIALQAGYFNGTSPSTASPHALVTREQAAVLLGRCLRFQGVSGAANSSFTDMQDIGGWSRPMVQEAAELGIIQGYADGSFRPGLPITRGQMACFLVRALGTLVQEPGEQTSGGVYGNLTITTPGVKLKDTTVTGNLYLTGGVGLGNVELENVNVLGKIVICGGGEAEKGKQSVLLRNVTAGSLELDSLADQFLSVQAEGLTNIEEVTVRTSGYLEDLTEDGLGLQTIRLDGVDGAQLQLAGNIKRVVNLTPGSTLQLAQGVADVITMDEKATDAKLTIDDRASIRELNLDRATQVDGKGSISHLNINAPGSKVTMLPDTIYIRPGITGNVYNQNMNTNDAAESSQDPRLLAGYPKAKNVAPTSANAVFSTNKTGTIHWAVTALMDGSLGEEELMNPGSYPKILRSGTLRATASNTEFTARLTGLTRQGSYYISALLEDARGRRSPVKIAAFTTPDDTAPNFANGYPQTPILTVDADNEQVAQIMVMANKDCQMYYVLLPRGSTAPTAADFRSAALPGNLGYGIVDLKKNTPFLVSRINTSHLQEQTQYDLYLWLNDADNGKSSAVRRVQLTTKDLTPPTIQFLRLKGKPGARQVTLEFALDEPGVLYWAVVKQGDSFYAAGIDKNNPGLPGQIQIENGTGTKVVRQGGPIRAARAGTAYTFAVTGLESQTAYDLYYVAKDLAGNYCVYSKTLTPPMLINTLDNERPTVTQEFDPKTEGTPPTPYPDSTVRLVFSEIVVGIRDKANDLYDSFEDAYNEARGGGADKERVFADLLRSHIKLYHRPASGRDELVPERTDTQSPADWVIDYRRAVVSRDDGKLIISFPNTGDKGTSAINFGSGESYYFVVSGIADNSDGHNELDYRGNREGYQLPVFTTIDARLILTAGVPTGLVNGVNTTFHMNFRITPDGTRNASDDKLWDLLVWADETICFQLYCDDGSGWKQLGDEVEILTSSQQPRSGVSITSQLLGSTNGVPNFEALNKVTSVRNYGIMVTQRGDSRDPGTWSGEAKLTLVPVAADLSSLANLAGANLTPDSYKEFQAGPYAVQEIGAPKEFPRSKLFKDTAAPTFKEGQPTFHPTDSGVSIDIMVSRDNCTYFCIVTEVGNIPTIADGVGEVTATNGMWDKLPARGSELPDGPTGPGNASFPSTDSITSGRYKDPSIYKIRNGRCGEEKTTIQIRSSDKDGGLKASTEYIAYFVLQGNDIKSASRVYAFQFKTEAVTRPILSVHLNSPYGSVEADREATVWYALVTAGTQQRPFNLKLSDFATNGTNGWDDGWNARYGSTSVLEAMQADAPAGMTGSLFDAFADLNNSNTKDIVRLLKSSGSTGGTILSPASAKLDATNNLLVERDYSTLLNQSRAEYWLVAIGQCQDTSGYAFRANSYLRRTDNKPPQVTGFGNPEITSGTFYAVEDRPLAMQEAYSGTIRIDFNEPLYWRVNSEVKKKIVDTPTITVAQDPNGELMPSSALLPANNQFSIEYQNLTFDTNNPPECTFLVIRFNNCRSGAGFSFSSNLTDVNNNPVEQNLSVTMSLVEEGGYLYPKFDFTSKAVADVWDGRTK